MKQLLLLGSAIAALAGSSTLAYLSKQPLPPDLTVLPATRNFGRVRQKTTHTAEFKLRNDTASRVKIERVVKSCDCSKPELSKTTLAPGEAAVLKVAWDVGLRHGPSGTHVDIVTSAEGRESGLEFARVELAADVLASFSVAPESLAFHRVGSVQRQRVVFQPHSEVEVGVKLLDVRTTHLALEAKVEPDGSGFVVTFTPERWPMDRDKAELLVETSSGTEGQRTILASVR